MKQLSKYILEQLDKGDRISTLITFKDNMMRASEIKVGIQHVFDDTNRDFNQDWYDNIKFFEYWNDEAVPVKYLGSDQGVLTFEPFSKNTVYQYNQKITKQLFKELDEPKTFIVWEGFKPTTPYYTRNRGKLKLNSIVVRDITYTPDFISSL